MAALLLAGVLITACTSDDSFAEEPTTNRPYTMTVNATKGNNAMTRVLKLESGQLKAEWKKNETVTVAKDKSGGGLTVIGTLKAQADGVTAKLTGTFDAEKLPAVNNLLYLYYPSFPQVYTGQKGTFDDVSENFDYARAVNVTVKEVDDVNKTITTANATFINLQSIVKFTLTDGSNPILAKKLTIHDENNHLITQVNTPTLTYGDIVIDLDDASSEVWAALNFNGVGQLTLTAETEGGKTYTKTMSSAQSFSIGKFYTTTVTMTLCPPAITLTSPAVGQVIGSDGKNYAAGASLPTGVTAVAMIAYLGSESNCTNGLAIAMTDETNEYTAITLAAAITASTAHTPTFSNGTWRLPTADDWQYMFIGCGSTDTKKDVSLLTDGTTFNYANINTMLTTAGGTPMYNNCYWTNSSRSSGYLYYYFYNKYFWSSSTNSSEYFARACLAF